MNRLLRAVIVSVLAILCAWVVVDAIVHAGSMLQTVAVPEGSPVSVDRIYVAFRNDDLSILSDPAREDSVIRLFWKYGIAQTYAFIPNPAGYLGGGRPVPSGAARMLDSLRSWHASGKVEFAVHGATHMRSPGSGGEFSGVAPEVQLSMLRTAKRTADSLLESDVTIFAPPWNESDCATVHGCWEVGLTTVSGYLGICPADGVAGVNSSAELFPDSSGVSSFALALEQARQGSGQRILVVFYHSRVDFNRRERYAYLDSLLGSLSSDPAVEWTTIGSLAHRFPETLALQNASGYTMLQADRAIALAHPYARVLGKLVPSLDLSRLPDPRGYDALTAYWEGQYHHAAELARVRIDWAKLPMLVARLLACVLTAATVGLLGYGFRSRGFVVRFGLPAFLGILLPLIMLVAVVALHPFSVDRLHDIADMVRVIVGTTGGVLAIQLLPLRSRDRVNAGPGPSTA